MKKVKDLDLFESAELIGEFFPPGKADQRFHGRLLYSPQDGLKLTYAILGHELPELGAVLHGVLLSGEPVTLLRHGAGFGWGFGYHNGISTRSGNMGFWGLVAGAHVGDDITFEQCTFSLSGIDEFIVPDGNTSAMPWSVAPLVTVPLSDGQFSVNCTGKFNAILDIGAVVHNTDPAALSDFKAAYANVVAKHPKKPFFFRRSMGFDLALSFTEPVSIESMLDRIHDIGAMFGLLFRTPVYPRRIGVRMDVGIGTPVDVLICPALYLDTGVIERANDSKSYHLMPLKFANVDLVKLLPAWLDVAATYRVLVSALQNQTGWYTRQTTLGSIVLHVMQFEAIWTHDGKPFPKKYEYVFATYASPALNARLHEYLGGTTHGDLAMRLSDLRGEIAHFGKPPTLLNALKGRVSSVAICLELIVVGFILKQIGVGDDLVGAYQDTFLPD